MGTRGLYGIRKNEIDKTTYNHYDSYPEYLGLHVLQFINKHTTDEISDLFDKIVLVQSGDQPTAEDIERCKGSTVLDVGNQSTSDWYCLLRDVQGNLDALFQLEFPYMIDDHEFIKESLFCEYAYIINLDTNMLEYYIGFQSYPTIDNRYGCVQSDGYYPCRLRSEIPISEIRNTNYDDLESLILKYMTGDDD